MVMRVAGAIGGAGMVRFWPGCRVVTSRKSRNSGGGNWHAESVIFRMSAGMETGRMTVGLGAARLGTRGAEGAAGNAKLSPMRAGEAHEGDDPVPG
jgi:hypothetical protein